MTLKMNRRISALAVSTFALLAAAPAFAAAPPVATPADLGTAVSAQIACASIFVAGRAEADVLRDDIHAFAPFTTAIALAVDRKTPTPTPFAPPTPTPTTL